MIYLKTFVLGSDILKEYIKKEIKPGKYEYGYYLQVLDIKTMLKLDVPMPEKIKNINIDNFKENEYLYFNDPECFEFIKNQYYIRDRIEFVRMNSYELEIAINIYNKIILLKEKEKKKIRDKDKLLDLEIELINLKNDVLSLKYMQEEKEIREKIL